MINRDYIVKKIPYYTGNGVAIMLVKGIWFCVTQHIVHEVYFNQYDNYVFLPGMADINTWEVDMRQRLENMGFTYINSYEFKLGCEIRFDNEADLNYFLLNNNGFERVFADVE
jgi:hypothetical protein